MQSDVKLERLEGWKGRVQSDVKLERLEGWKVGTVECSMICHIEC